MTKIFLNHLNSGRGGPHVWSQRFEFALAKRGYQVTVNIDDDWSASLFVIQTADMDIALTRSRNIGYRVANGYLPAWFQAMDLKMKPIHHVTNASIARGLEISPTVIYQSQWAKYILDQNLYERQAGYAIIYNGVDLERFKPATSPFERPFTIGTIGILRYRYRLETLFEMSKRLNFPHRLLIIGSMDKECSQVLEIHQNDPQFNTSIEYKTFVAPESLPAVYQQMDILIHPVSGDACPNVVSEALACGVPVVAPNFGGTAEIVAGGGVIFESKPWSYDQDFIDAMADAAQNAFRHRNHLSRLARQQAEEHLNLHTMTANYLQALGLPDQAPINLKTEMNAKNKPSIRQTFSRLGERPRYYAAVTLRKASQAQRRIFPPQSNQKPRVAFVLFDFHIGGIENWLYRLATHLKTQFDFYFLATIMPNTLPKFEEAGVFAFLPNPAQMISYLQKHHIDIVQVHNERWPIDAALAAGVPYIIERLGGPRSWRRAPKFGLDLVIASTEMGAHAISDMLPSEKIRVIYNGIDLQMADQAVPHRFFSPSTCIIGRASRFGRGQNLEMLIEALAQLAPNYPQLRLVLVGGDSHLPGAEPVEKMLREKVARYHLDEYVHFAGYSEDPLPLVKGFDIGTCVSKDEGIPNSLIEAMACNKPVISTRVGAISELIRDRENGLLIPSDDVGALCESIEQLLIQPDLFRRLGDAGRKTIEERFSLENSASKYAQIFWELLNR